MLLLLFNAEDEWWCSYILHAQLNVRLYFSVTTKNHWYLTFIVNSRSFFLCSPKSLNFWWSPFLMIQYDMVLVCLRFDGWQENSTRSLKKIHISEFCEVIKSCSTVFTLHQIHWLYFSLFFSLFSFCFTSFVRFNRSQTNSSFVDSLRIEDASNSFHFIKAYLF